MSIGNLFHIKGNMGLNSHSEHGFALDSNLIFISFHHIHCALQTTGEEEEGNIYIRTNTRSFLITFESF